MRRGGGHAPMPERPRTLSQVATPARPVWFLGLTMRCIEEAAPELVQEKREEEKEREGERRREEGLRMLRTTCVALRKLGEGGGGC